MNNFFWLPDASLDLYIPLAVGGIILLIVFMAYKNDHKKRQKVLIYTFIGLIVFILVYAFVVAISFANSWGGKEF